jgi:hypothetical protein
MRGRGLTSTDTLQADGEASKQKAERRRAKRSPAEMRELLGENMDFLRASSGAYDSGFPGEAKRMAVSLRVLHSTTPRRRSASWRS